MLDDQARVFHQRGESLGAENLYVIGRLEIAGRSDAFLQMFAYRGRYAQQVQRAGAAHAHQFGHEGFWLIDVFQYFHAHDFAGAALGQWQRQTVADQPQARLV
ncbi:hypothetical protein D3C78_648750 [compost metagenome]